MFKESLVDIALVLLEICILNLSEGGITLTFEKKFNHGCPTLIINDNLYQIMF